jgi:hypothetical protein
MTLFTIPAISVTVAGLISGWTGLVLFVIWCFVIYEIDKKSDDLEGLYLLNIIQGPISIFLDLICSKQKKISSIGRIYLSLFYFSFPCWFFCRFLYSFDYLRHFFQ